MFFTRKKAIMTKVATSPGERKKLNELKENSVHFRLSKSNLIQNALRRLV